MKKKFLFHLKATKEKVDKFKVLVLIITRNDNFEIMCVYVPFCFCDYLMHIIVICFRMLIITHVILRLGIWLCTEILIFSSSFQWRWFFMCFDKSPTTFVLDLMFIGSRLWLFHSTIRICL
jgi:hypothetical protein